MEYPGKDQLPAEESGDSEADLLAMPVQRGEDMDGFQDDDDSESCTETAGYCADFEDRKVMAWSAWLAAVAEEVAEKQVEVAVTVTVAVPMDEAEKNRLFWETCLALGYP
ncbi:hypothetical protein IEQ34_000294 [Dendrobium chrysotoxum]|uniref:Uncharacterized protein n=1 Tax=Dendrobium chrysotoxum TaxID=161865 RepID=A0AAV7HPE0_DENCH|nr:hypothetical protein IEQ34_000294 [Dendrobium chrysotoxum]